MQPLPGRQLRRPLGLIAGGRPVACTPLRVLPSASPQAFDDDAELTDGVLRAFALTVIPSAPAGDPDLTRAFTDPDLPFAPYAGFFASDLARRAQERVQTPFERLYDLQRAPPIPEGPRAARPAPQAPRRRPLPVAPGV